MQHRLTSSYPIPIHLLSNESRPLLSCTFRFLPARALRSRSATTPIPSPKTEIRLCESLSKKPGPSPTQLTNGNGNGNGSGDEHGKAEQQKERQKKEEEKKAKKDVFDPANWDSLLVDSFDGGFGEEYGVLLVSARQGKLLGDVRACSRL